MNMSASIEKTIDIEKILKSKMGSKAKYVPFSSFTPGIRVRAS